MNVTPAALSAATSSPGSSASQGADAPPPKLISSDFQMFLKMLTAQIRNQDPLNPIEGSDYAVQLATFSGVEQQVQTNALLSSLVGQMGVSAMGQYAGWVGMDARSSAAVPFNGQPLTLYPTPAKGAARTFLVAYDSTGREAMRQEIPVSDAPVQWTGKTATGAQVLNGTYRFKLESVDGTGKVIADDRVDAFARVTEVRQSPTGPLLVLAGGATVSPAEVKALRPPPTP